MKTFVVVLLVLLAAASSAWAQHAGHEHGSQPAKGEAAAESGSQKGQAAETAVYKCPMHPEVTSEKPGKCPKCGMRLTEEGRNVAYRCPMHPDVVSDKPGTCPRCKGPLYPFTHPDRFESK